jgi:hypothetical protein
VRFAIAAVSNNGHRWAHLVVHQEHNQLAVTLLGSVVRAAAVTVSSAGNLQIKGRDNIQALPLKRSSGLWNGCLTVNRND